jgi:hypothetical protein
VMWLCRIHHRRLHRAREREMMGAPA